MSGSIGIDMLRDWDAHNRPHSCYYDSAENDGTGECPSYYATLGDYLGAAGFPVEDLKGQFFGRDLSEPNFRSRISGKEKPVSVAELRRRGDLRANKGIHYRDSTTQALSTRAQRAAGGAVENDEAAWQVEAMGYFKDRLDEIHESMVRGMAGIMAEQGRLHTRIDALVELVSKEIDERSESRVAVAPKVVVTLENVPADVAEELQAELSTRVQRIMARRAQHSDSC